MSCEFRYAIPISPPLLPVRTLETGSPEKIGLENTYTGKSRTTVSDFLTRLRHPGNRDEPSSELHLACTFHLCFHLCKEGEDQYFFT